MRTSVFSFAVILSLAVFLAPTSPVPAQPVGEMIFSAAERRIIAEYYAANYRDADDDGDSLGANERGQGKGKGKSQGQGQGKGRSGGLPPGLEKHLERNGQLPPGLAGRDLPAGLSGQLPPLRQGTRRIVVDRDVVLIDIATNVVIDVLIDVLGRRN